MEERHIAKSIKAFYIRNTIIPIILISFVLFLQVVFHSFDVLFPERVTDGAQISGKNQYVSIQLEEVFPAGYQMLNGNAILGNYYYSFYNGKCLYLVIPISEAIETKEGILKDYNMFGKLMYMEGSLSNINEKISSELSWTTASLTDTSYPYVICNIASNVLMDRLIAIFLLIVLLFAIYKLVYDIISAFRQHLSPVGRAISRYGDPKQIMEMADEELSTLPQLTTEDMFITEHFFILLSTYQIAIVPIDQIVWIYKHSTLHQFFGKPINISYTMHITAHLNYYFNCPKNIKSDIDGIIDYLTEANHDIIVGFTEEKRALAMERIASDPSFKKWLQEPN